jgi:hypothetical protein
MQLQDFAFEHDSREVIAVAARHAIDWGARVEGYFICPTAPVVPPVELPSHTLAEYRRYHGQPVIQPAVPFSGYIASIGACRCLESGIPHPRYGTLEELSAAVVELLRGADATPFLKMAGSDGPFHGTDALIHAGYRLCYCSWYGRGLWVSFRHIYVGK